MPPPHDRAGRFPFDAHGRELAGTASADTEATGTAHPRLAGVEGPLWLTGAELPRVPIIALVGTRRPSEHGAAFAAELARALTEAGVVVASGGALGVDAAAHEGALAAGGRTVVVAPASFARPYPAAHAGLFERVVAAGGSYLAVASPGTRCDRALFFRRNRVLARLATALVVVQAGHRSGARNAAREARLAGTPVWAVPHSPWDGPVGAGCNVELSLGARPLADARSLLRSLGKPLQLELGG